MVLLLQCFCSLVYLGDNSTCYSFGLHVCVHQLLQQYWSCLLHTRVTGGMWMNIISVPGKPSLRQQPAIYGILEKAIYLAIKMTTYKREYIWTSSFSSAVDLVLWRSFTDNVLCHWWTLGDLREIGTPWGILFELQLVGSSFYQHRSCYNQIRPM